MRSLVSFITALTLVVGFVSLAQAEDDERFAPARKVIEGSGVKVLEVTPGKDFKGREALIVTSDMKMNDVVAHFRGLFKEGKELDGSKVIGLAHIVHNDTWNITLSHGDSTTTFKVSAEAKGSRLTIRERHRPPKRKK